MHRCAIRTAGGDGSNGTHSRPCTIVPMTLQVVMTGNQAPKSVDITQEGMDAGKEVSVAGGVAIFFSWWCCCTAWGASVTASKEAGLAGVVALFPIVVVVTRSRDKGRCLLVLLTSHCVCALTRVQELSKRVTAAMQDSHTKSVAVAHKLLRVCSDICVQELSKRVTAAMQDSHTKSVAVGSRLHLPCLGCCPSSLRVLFFKALVVLQAMCCMALVILRAMFSRALSLRALFFKAHVSALACFCSHFCT
eukprot:1160185-Pelagomonas_calceolata.AAC.5